MGSPEHSLLLPSSEGAFAVIERAYVAVPHRRGYLPNEVFGVSLTEFTLIIVVALVVLGPQRLPGMLRTVGIWLNKLRRMTTEVRAQTGIDDLLRNEGFHGGLAEVRALLRGDPRPLLQQLPREQQEFVEDPYVNGPAIDESRERPIEGPDAYGAIPEDLLDESEVLLPLDEDEKVRVPNGAS